jgi:DNA repair exonuclease SbcCD ATPase subunit
MSSYKYYCDTCDFKSCKQSEYKRHLNTIKHRYPTQTKVTSFICKCGKTYKERSGLWKHEKKCKLLNKTSNEEQPIENTNIIQECQNLIYKNIEFVNQYKKQSDKREKQFDKSMNNYEENNKQLQNINKQLQNINKQFQDDNKKLQDENKQLKEYIKQQEKQHNNKVEKLLTLLNDGNTNINYKDL